MPADTIPVDIAIASNEWRVCHYQTILQRQPVLAPIANLVQFIKCQPAYISQYYDHIKCEMSDAEVY